MKGKKLDPRVYKEIFDGFFKDGTLAKSFAGEDYNELLESYVKSELFGITVYYVVSGMEIENPNITDTIKTKVEETFRVAKDSQFDFLHDFHKLILFMQPMMPFFDEDFTYRGVGTLTSCNRSDEETVLVGIHGGFLTKRIKGVAFNGVLSHELVELDYTEQNLQMLEQLPKDEPSQHLYHDVAEIAVDERVYAINPRYCVEMQQTTFDEYFKKAVKGTDPITIGLMAPLAYLSLLKLGDHAGKFLRKRVLDCIRGKDRMSEILALQYEHILSKIPLYTPQLEDYLNTVESMKRNLSRI